MLVASRDAPTTATVRGSRIRRTALAAACASRSANREIASSVGAVIISTETTPASRGSRAGSRCLGTPGSSGGSRADLRLEKLTPAAVGVDQLAHQQEPSPVPWNASATLTLSSALVGFSFEVLRPPHHVAVTARQSESSSDGPDSRLARRERRHP